MLVICTIIAAVLFPLGFMLRGFARLRVFIITAAFALGLFWCFAFAEITRNSVKNYDGTTTYSKAVVTSYPVPTARGFSVDISLRQKRITNVGARLYYTDRTDLTPGDVIELTARFSASEAIENSDIADALTAKSRFLTASAIGEIVTTDKTGILRYMPLKLSFAVSGLIDRMFPADVSHFMRALLTGKRDMLNTDTAVVSHLAVSGISHIVAVSGMHVSFLMGFLSVFIKRRRLYAFVAFPVLLLFMAMTGFTPSVTRAGIMQLFVITSAPFGREYDGITSLSAALFILLAVNPYSVTSTGLQLSFAASLGIILFTEKLTESLNCYMEKSSLFKNKASDAALRFVSASLFTTVGASALTIPLAAVHFGIISIIAPITNLLTLWAVSLAFSIGLAACIAGFVFFPAGSVLAIPAAFAARFILLCARLLASVPNAAVYVSNSFIVIWLFYVYVVIIALKIAKQKAKTYLYAGCFAVIALCIILLLSSHSTPAGDANITVLDVGQGQSIVISSGGKTAMIDCGGESGKNAGDIAHKYLASQGLETLDLLIITHFHYDHAGGAEYLLNNAAVKILAIPDPEDSYLADDIIEAARRRGTEIIYITETLTAQLGSSKITMYPPLGIGDENESCVAILTQGGGLDMLVTGDMDSASERRLLRYTELPEVDILVVGHHGSRFSTSNELLQAAAPKIAVISVGRNNYGHPAETVIERLTNHGAEVCRTDLSGTLTFVPE